MTTNKKIYLNSMLDLVSVQCQLEMKQKKIKEALYLTNQIQEQKSSNCLLESKERVFLLLIFGFFSSFSIFKILLDDNESITFRHKIYMKLNKYLWYFIYTRINLSIRENSLVALLSLLVYDRPRRL